MKKISIILFFLFLVLKTFSSSILIPMDDSQKNHLKAYGIAYWTLERGVDVKWLLNYRGGSFMIDYVKELESECLIRGVSFEVIADAKQTLLLMRYRAHLRIWMLFRCR